jgi:hypothetical protein
MNSGVGVQACGLCSPELSDLDAALRLALLVGGQVMFWQHDEQRSEDLEAGLMDDREDLVACGFELRHYTRPVRADDDVLYGTDPWVELDHEPVNWRHAARMQVLLTGHLRPLGGHAPG